MDTKHSPNPVLNRYFIGLQAFRFQVEWVPGLRMIADPFSRMVVVNDGEVAIDVTVDVRSAGNFRSTYSTLVFDSLSPAPASVVCS